MPLEYTPLFRIAMLGNASVVSDIKKASREQAQTLEAALSSRVAPPNLSNLITLQKTINDVSKRVTTTEGGITTLTKRVTTLEGNTPLTATATPASGWTVNSGTITRLSGLMFAALDLTYSTAMANGAVMCTLPAGYRPPSSMTVMGVQSEGGASGPLTVAISATGEVKVWPGTTTNKRAGVQLFWKAR